MKKINRIKFPLTLIELCKNILRIEKFPKKIIKTVHDVEFDGINLKFKLKIPLKTSGWRARYSKIK